MDLLFYLMLIGIGAGVATAPGGGSFDDEFGIVGEAPTEEPDLVPDFGDTDFGESDAAQAEAEDPGFGTGEADIAADLGFVAEDQAGTGRMTTATEVRPILTATKGSWVAVREWEGQDLLYFTNLLAWRCGLHQIGYRVNDGPEEILPAEPCYTEEGAPNALKVEDILPYVTLPLQSLQTVTVTVLYDDLSTDSAEYSRDLIRID